LRDEPPERLTGRRLLAVIEAGEIVHGSPFLFSVPTDPGAPVKWFPASTPIAELVTELNEAQPSQINFFASSLQEIAAEALAGRLMIRPHRVTANSEPLMPETRDAARHAWGLEINNMWGCVEVGHIGIECDAHEGLHRSDDLVITEFVDHDDRPTRDPDTIDRILVTSLFGRTLPLIRYELTDVPIPSDRLCSCGAALVFRTPLGQNSRIEQYQVHQTETGARIGVIATAPIDVPALKHELVAALPRPG